MENIQIREYVRTKNGYILRNTIKEHKYIIDNFEEYKNKFGEIVKHSKNIINLIEIGDYVNEYPVRLINNKLCNFDLNLLEWCELERISLDGLIETILTKERYEEECYKV